MSILTGKVVVDKDARFNERCILPLFETGRLVRLRSIATGEAVGSFFPDNIIGRLTPLCFCEIAYSGRAILKFLSFHGKNLPISNMTT